MILLRGVRCVVRVIRLALDEVIIILRALFPLRTVFGGVPIGVGAPMFVSVIPSSVPTLASTTVILPIFCRCIAITVLSRSRSVRVVFKIVGSSKFSVFALFGIDPVSVLIRIDPGSSVPVLVVGLIPLTRVTTVICFRGHCGTVLRGHPYGHRFVAIHMAQGDG